MSLKVIKIDEPFGESLTADSTLITADTTQYTADQTLSGEPNEYQLSVIPRFYAEEVKLILINEDTDTKIVMEVPAEEVNGKLLVNFTADFEDGNSFETTITDLSDALMWRGKIYATLQDDLENFTLYPKTNNKIVV